MKTWDRLKKLIRESNPMTKKVTFVEKCLNGGCYNVKKGLDFLIYNIPDDSTLQKELGLTNEEYNMFINSNEPYATFQQILIERLVEKK